jgi:CheY-like chemotaxis protein
MTDKNAASPSAPSGGQAKSRASTKSETKTILVVDDDSAIRDAVQELLEDHGYEVVLAGDGVEALERLAAMAAPPSLILLDLKMPRMDGWEFLTERNGSVSGARVPVVLLSGMTFIRDAPGVVDFLAKPLRPDKLLDCVRRFCGEAASRV